MSDEWGGGEWWEIWPPPFGSDDGDDYNESFDGELPEDWDSLSIIPPELDYPEYSYEEEMGLDAQFTDAWDFLTDIDNVDPGNIRGVGFESIYEAVEWLQAIGVLSFSSVIYQDDLYYPVIGEYDNEGTTESDAGDFDPGTIPF